MRKFEDILRDKLYDAKSDFPSSIWDDIKNEIPIEKSKPSNGLWIGFFLCSFAFIIFTINQYPSWKANETQNRTAEILNTTEFEGFISSMHEIENLPTNNLTFNINGSSNQIVNNNSNLFLKNEKIASSPSLISNSINQITQVLWTNSEIENQDQTNLGAANEISKNFLPLEVNTNHELAVKKKPLPTLNLPEEDVYCEIHHKPDAQYYIGTRHISSYAFNSLRAKSEGLNEYTNSRLSSESKKYSFSDEVTFGASFQNGYIAEIGIRYDQINEKFNYKDFNATGSTVLINSDTINNGSGNTEIIVDTVMTDVVGVREVINHNKFRKISIPVSLGYEVPLNKKVTLGGKAGLVVNVWSKYDGKMFDGSGNIVEISEVQQSKSPFFKTLVHNASASLYLQYNVNDNLSFVTGLNGYKNLGATSHEFYGIEQKYSSLGLFVGGKYLL